MKSQFTSLLFMLAALALTLGPNPAMADVETLSVSGPSQDGPLAATATFTTSDGQLTVTLTNDLKPEQFGSQGQAVSDISLTLSNTVSGNFSTSTASGQFGDVGSDNTVTYKSSDTTPPNDTTPVRWFANGSVSGNTVTLEALGGSQPSQMIAPFVPNGGSYPNAGGGVPNFNSYVIGTATFTMNLSGVTADTTVSSATISFGTQGEFIITGTPQVVTPEPSTTALAALGALGFMGYGLRRRPKT